MKFPRFSLLLALIPLLLASLANAQQSPPAAPTGPLTLTARSPDDKSKNICIDTHLNLTFSRPPTLGTTGQVRIYDSADNTLVDTIDLALPTNQQHYIIGGSDLHAYPILISDNTATIYPHNNKLTYNKTYYVQMDPGVLTDAASPFPGYTGNAAWTFSTKTAPPAPATDRLTVSPDGTADFATVQGAIDFVPENNPKRITIFLRKGLYTEIVSFIAKNNITFLGEDRLQTIVAYPNNNNFQPNLTNPQGQFSGSSYRRGVFMGLNSSGIVLANFTVHNTTPKGGSQAEGILFKELRGQTGPNNSQTIITHMTLLSHIDTIQITGKAYLEGNYVEGDNDYMWGDGPCFFINDSFRNLHDGTSFTQPRNPADHHGFVIVDSKFEGASDVSAAYLGNGTGMSETVIIDCKIGPVLRPEGWNSRGANNAEFNTTTLADGKPYDMTKWPAFVKHLDKDKDAQTIANYRNPTWVLGGWTAALAPIILTQPTAATAPAGQPTKLTVVAAGIPAPTYQWQRNGTPLKDGAGFSGATTDTLTLTSPNPSDAATYTVTLANPTGTATSTPAALTIH